MGLGLDLTGATVGGLAREISGHLNDTYEQEARVQDLDATISMVQIEDEENAVIIVVSRRKKTPAEQDTG